jgi:hypothetical protein
MGDSLGTIQRELLAKIGKCESVKDFYLAGGTALTIQLGHRLSMDFDFFSYKPLNGDRVLQELGLDAMVEVTGMEPGTLHLKMEGVPVSFFEYHYELLEKNKYHEIALASLTDIALMKIMAIQQRGLRKDFIDLYAICRTGITLPNLLDLMKKKYPNVKFDRIAVFKSLSYFGDAVDEVPLLIKDIDWETVKKFFRKEVRNMAD